MPCTATGCPFTLIRPASIMSSQTRREPTPARASTFCSRSPCRSSSARRLAVARVDGGELHVLGPAVAGCGGGLVVGRCGVHRRPVSHRRRAGPDEIGDRRPFGPPESERDRRYGGLASGAWGPRPADAGCAWPPDSTSTISDDGDGTPPVVLLHGWAGSRRSFAALLPLLATHTHVVAVDVRGHGDADKPPAGYDLATLAGDVVATLDAVGSSSRGAGRRVQRRVPRAAGRRERARSASPASFSPGRPATCGAVHRSPTKSTGSRDPVDPAWVRSFTAGFTDLDRLPSWYVDVMVEDGLRLPAAIWQASLAGADHLAAADRRRA